MRGWKWELTLTLHQIKFRLILPQKLIFLIIDILYDTSGFIDSQAIKPEARIFMVQTVLLFIVNRWPRVINLTSKLSFKGSIASNYRKSLVIQALTL